MRLFSPAKINLFLAVTGRRADGFHDLLSLVVPLDFGDWLEVAPQDGPEDRLECDRPGIPLDASNLVLRAAEVFRRRTGWSGRFSFRLEKRIPAGGGFGGGSGNAVRALEGMNELAGQPLGGRDLAAAAAELGSDCPLFLEKGPVVLRGRGERVEAVPEWARLLVPWRAVLFDSGVPVSTAGLYRAFAEEGRLTPPADAEAGLEQAKEAFSSGDPLPLLRNDLGVFLARRHLFYETWAALLAQAGFSAFGITGSGSGCFALFRGTAAADGIGRTFRRWLGEAGFMIETGFLRAEDQRSKPQ